MTPNITRAEVLRRSEEMNTLLHATYGRLQHGLLIPLTERVLKIISENTDVTKPAVSNVRVPVAPQNPLEATASVTDGKPSKGD